MRFQGAVAPLAALASWWAAAHAGVLPPLLVPGPEKVWHTALELVRDRTLLPSLWLSLLLVGYGLFIGTAAGLLLGTAMGVSRTVERLCLPLFNAVRQVPLVAWIPLIIIWCGIGEMSKIIFIAMGASYPVVLNTLAGIKGVARHYVEVAQVFEYGRIRLLWRVLLPAALPSILTGIRLSLSKSWTMVIGAEAFMATVSMGIGNLMSEGGDHGRMDVVIVGIIIIGLIGFLMNQAVRLAELRLLRWNRGLT
jgi:sulfonate transport system permease protein